MMAADTLERLGIARGDYLIKVNNRKVLDGVLEVIGLAGEENAGRRMIVLRAIDKLDRLGLEGVRLLLGPGRRDESGDFTKGAGLGAAQIDRVEAYVSAGGMGALLASFSESALAREGLQELADIAALAGAAGYEADRIRIDPSVVRGLEYYTGPVFEAELTFEVMGEDGAPIRFGSVGGGGRYDGLVGRFRGENVPATGFSIGVSRLFSALKAIRSPIVEGISARGPVVVLVLDKDQAAGYQRFVAELRAAGIAAELYLGASGMNAQLKYADKRGSVCAVIQGSNEREHKDGPQVTIRDLVLGAELAAATKDRADYLELRAKAQFSVAETGLIAAVTEVLARHS
jgi:histidyl-tRNA synthetase